MNPAWIWGISALATAGVIFRPYNWPEAIWAVTGALLIVALGLLPAKDAWSGVLKGTDVYLFLIGMMLLSEVSRREGLFDWLAAFATEYSRGSPSRLFGLIYGIGVLVTVFLSNDATAVVLTPAVYAASRIAKVKDPLPYLLICAMIANAASFVLPISNPANLVVFSGSSMPPLGDWLKTFSVPSALAIVATFIALRWTQRKAIASDTVTNDVHRPTLTSSAKIASAGIVVTVIVLLLASSRGMGLGFPTFVSGVITTLVILAVGKAKATDLLADVSWSVLPLVAGLFVLVSALQFTGTIQQLSDLLHHAVETSPNTVGFWSGIIVAFASNLANNLPSALVAGSTVHAANAPHDVAASILIGVDLGPNLSVTGSLATILWLNALRREGLDVSTWTFLKVGFVVMPPALLLALAGLLFTHLPGR